MIQLGFNLANKYQRRTLRVLYGGTQAYPYNCTLSSSFDRTAGALSGADAITGAKSAIYPGLCAVKSVGEAVTTASTAFNHTSAAQRIFGLFANYVGGEISDIPTDVDLVGVWRGPGSVYEVLAPAFDDTSLATDAAAEDGAVANEVYLANGAKAQLALADDSPGAHSVNQPARLIKRLSANAIIVELLV